MPSYSHSNAPWNRDAQTSYMWERGMLDKNKIWGAKPPSSAPSSDAAPQAPAPNYVDPSIKAMQNNIDRLLSERSQLKAEQDEAYAALTADTLLTEQELAEFEEEYENELEAFREEFDVESGRYGAKEMAALVHAGVLDTTTGRNKTALTQERFAKTLAAGESSLGEAKELAKTDLDAAKRQLALGKYNLLSGMRESQLSTALEASRYISDFFLTGGEIEASSNLNKALLNQQQELAKYQTRMNMWGSLSGFGMGMIGG